MLGFFEARRTTPDAVGTGLMSDVPRLQAPPQPGGGTEPRASRQQAFLAKIQITAVTSDHVLDLADLHFEELHWSLNGHLGKEHIRDLYRAIALSPGFFGYACYNGNELLGFVTATTDIADTRARVFSVYRPKLFAVLGILMRRPRFLIAALESKFAAPWVFRAMGARGEWLTLVTQTKKAYIAPFVALRLIDAVRTRFLAEGIDFYVAQGYKINPKAMKMYAELKWEVAAQLFMHKIYRFPSGRSDEQ